MLKRTVLTTSVKGLLQEMIPTIPEATTWTHHNRRHQNPTPMESTHSQMFAYKESGPEGAGLPDAGRGGERHTGEREGQDHGPQAHMTQPQVQEQPGPASPPD